MSTADERKSLARLLSEVIWCTQKGGRLTWPNFETIENARRKEGSLRSRILPLLELLERRAFNSLSLHFSQKASRPVAPNPYWNELQYTERAAWGISIIAPYLDQTYVDQIEELVARAPQVESSKVESYLQRALNRIPA